MSQQLTPSMQAWPFEQAAAIGRCDFCLKRAAVAVDRKRHLDARLADGPDLAKQAPERIDLGSRNREHHVADAQVRARGRAALGKASDDELVLHLGGVQSEPRSWRMIRSPH